MSLPELIVSTTIFGLVVVGSTASALLLAKVASDHENRADFSTDIRNGMEQMAFDVRNADSIVSRADLYFVLGDENKGNITYRYLVADKKVIRSQNGNSIDIFTNVKTFDVLKDAADAPNGMTYDKSEIAIEKLEFDSENGTGKASNLLIQQFALKARNS